MNPKLKAVAATQGGVFSVEQARRCGYTAEQIRQHLRANRWRRIRSGQFAEAVDRSGMPPWQRLDVEHREAVHAVMNSMRRGAVVVSHQSALVLHGITQWDVSRDEVHVTRTDGRRGRSVAGVRHHAGRLSPEDLTAVEGLPVCTPARALFETACTTSYASAVVGFDAGLRADKLTEPEIERLLNVIRQWPGGPTARSALAFADGRSESAGESRLRLLMAEIGLPKPELQVEFSDSDGPFARVDFYFPEFRTVVEFDGMIKYADKLAEVVLQEKRREDRLRDLGLEVVRVTWVDLTDPEGIARRIRQAFARRIRSVASH